MKNNDSSFLYEENLLKKLYIIYIHIIYCKIFNRIKIIFNEIIKLISLKLNNFVYMYEY